MKLHLWLVTVAIGLVLCGSLGVAGMLHNSEITRDTIVTLTGLIMLTILAEKGGE